MDNEIGNFQLSIINFQFSPPRLWIQITFLVIVTWAVYQFAPHAMFMTIDDGSLTYKNPLVQNINLQTLKGIFTTYDPELYIPLTLLSYQIDYFLGGGAPGMFHTTNLILHSLNAVLVLLLLRKLPEHALAPNWVPLLTALLFALHPLHTEAVMWIAGRKDLLSATFFLGSLVLYCSHRKSPSKKIFIASVGLFVLAAMSKVTAVTLPLILILIDDLLPSKEKDNMSKWAYYIPALLFLLIGMFGKTLSVYVLSYFETFLLAAKSSVFYLQKILWPTDFLMFYQQLTPIEISRPEFTLPLMILICAFVFILNTRSVSKLISFGLLWYGIILLPNLANFSKWSKLSVFFATDRYAYLPSIGILFLLATTVVILNNTSRFRHAGAIIIVGIVGTLGYLTHQQSKLWLTPVPLFEHIVSVEPRTHMAHTVLGIEAMNADDYALAVTHFRTASNLAPNFPDARAHLGLSLIKNDQIEEGLLELQKTVDLKPDYTAAHVYLGFGQLLAGDDAAAKETLEFALSIEPGTAKAHHLLGEIAHRNGNTKEALKHFEASLEANPRSVRAKSALMRLQKSAL